MGRRLGEPWFDVRNVRAERSDPPVRAAALHLHLRFHTHAARSSSPQLSACATVERRYQYDDPRSLSLKYELASKLGLRGVGPFSYPYLDYSTAQGRREAAAMWAALHAFTGGESPVEPS